MKKDGPICSSCGRRLYVHFAVTMPGKPRLALIAHSPADYKHCKKVISLAPILDDLYSQKEEAANV